MTAISPKLGNALKTVAAMPLLVNRSTRPAGLFPNDGPQDHQGDPMNNGSRLHAPSSAPRQPELQLLARLDAGEVLEQVLGLYQIRADPVPKRLVESSIEEGWDDAPPDLFNLAGGRITDLGRDVLRSNGGLADV